MLNDLNPVRWAENVLNSLHDMNKKALYDFNKGLSMSMLIGTGEIDIELYFSEDHLPFTYSVDKTLEETIEISKEIARIFEHSDIEVFHYQGSRGLF